MTSIPPAQIKLIDKVLTGLLLGSFLWLFDSGMTLFSRASIAYSYRPIILLGALLFFIVFSFWIARKIFNYGVWSFTPHRPSDRIWVALLAATVQLALEFVGLYAISPGKLMATLAYAVICSFGAVSSYRRDIGSVAVGTDSNQIARQELLDIRGRIAVSSIFLTGCVQIFRGILEFQHLIKPRVALTLTLFLFAVGFGAYIFGVVHGRCPRCGRGLTKRGKLVRFARGCAYC